MNARDILTYSVTPVSRHEDVVTVSADAMLAEVFAAMTRNATHTVLIEGADASQSITPGQAVTAMADMLYYDSECSELQLNCPAHLYSASSIALAAEDADAAVVSLLAYPSIHNQGELNVYLRINRSDPSRTIRSLERRGYTVSAAKGADYTDEELTRERLSELQHYLNI